MKAFLNRLIGRRGSPAGNFELFFDGNPSAPNVLIFTEHINATYFISFEIPLRALHAKGQINFAVASQKHVELHGRNCWERWAKDFCPDIVIMTRYGQSDGSKILDFFHQRGISVIYHIDDDLLEVPDSLGAEIRQRQGADDVVKTRTYLLRNCDLIYASTSHLADLMRTRFFGQQVFHGIYAPYMGESIASSKIRPRTNPLIGYMGSKGHQHDLELVVPALERLLDERPALEFEVFGTVRMPKVLERFRGRVRSHSVQKSYTEFLSTLAGLGWDIGLAPLVDAPFNRCKAPTKFIEYTACGIPVIASNIPVYADVIPENGGLLVDRDWYSVMSQFLDNAYDRNQALSISKRHCSSSFSLNTLEKQLLNVFNQARIMEKK